MNGRLLGWIVVAAAMLPVVACAQQQGLFGSSHEHDYVTYPEKIFFLRHAVRTEDPDEIVTALRNMLDPKDRVYLIAGRQAIMVEAPVEQLALAEKYIHEIDVPRPEVEMHVVVLEVSRAKMDGLVTGKDGEVIDAEVGLWMQDKDTKVLADQRLRTTSKYAIVLKSGSKTPFASEIPSGEGKVTKINMIDTGVRMNITPYVHEDGMIDVWMQGDVSMQTGTTTIGGVTEPVIAQTTLESNPQVHEGKTTLLAASRLGNEAEGLVVLLTTRIVWTPAP